MNRTSVRAALAVALVLTAAACNGGNDDKPKTTTTTAADDTAPSPSASYNDRLLDEGQKQFLTVVWKYTPKRSEISAMSAQDLKAMTETYAAECSGRRKDREQSLKGSPTGQKVTPEQFTEVLNAWDELCGIEPGAREELLKHVKISNGHVDPDYGGGPVYLYDLSITNLGKDTADYRVTIEAYDKDGDFLGEQSAFAERLGPDKTNRQPEQLIVPNGVSNGTIADIADLKVTDVERVPGGTLLQ
ncbi:hypothetical protein OG818_25860 [Streptomyces virginiae]|uniref:hypothetical protein n=1 Tax=Streptomyces virginiae TaxID=1961 RepID=UPI00224D5307|nr:hypothetical protein [Streptomyces virginiae]MCX4719168.1 hypothetical protein [Streptomyces virginiae]